MRGVDLIRVQIERNRLLSALEAAMQEAVQSRIDLFRQMDRPPEPNVSLSDSLDSDAPLQTVSLTVVLATRADVAVAREAVTQPTDVRLQRAVGFRILTC